MNVSTIKRFQPRGRGRLGAALAVATVALLTAPLGAYAATAANVAVTPGVMTTYAGTTSNGGGGGFGNGGPATSANLYNPAAVRFDGAGNLYILDAGNMVIRKVIAPGLPGGGTIVAFAGTGIAGNSGDGGQAAGATFSATARGMFVNAAGVIWISDSGNNAVRMIDLTGKITTVAGTNGSAVGYTGDGGPATLATLSNPGGIYVDAAGNLYIADTGNNVIRVVNPSGVISTFAGGTASVCAKAADSLGDGCPYLQTNFLAPADVWGDAAGNLDILDAGNFRVRRANVSTGLITSIVGTGAKGAGDSTSATGGTIGAGDTGIVIDSAGDLFIADTGNSKIRMVTVAGALISVAGNGTAGPAGDGNSAISAYLNLPMGMTVDASNNIYIADTQNSRIREVLVNASVVNLTSQAVGVASSSSTANTATFLNTGTAPLTFTAITVTAPFAEKTGVSTDCKVGTAVAVGATCTLTLLYTPTTAGYVTGSATLQSNAANAPSGATTLQLNGTGVAAGTTKSATTLTTSFPGVPSETLGQSVTLTATVSSATASNLTPTGTVQFTSGTVVLGTATLSPAPTSVSLSAAVATFTTTALTVGVDSVVATYLGDVNYATSPSAAQIIGVFTGAMDFAFSANTTSLSVANGTSATIVLNAYSLGGYSGTVGFQCPNLPPGATCTFVPFTAYIGPGRQSVPNVTLTLAFPLPIGTSQNRQSFPWRSRGEIGLAFLLFGAFVFRKKGRAAMLPALMLAIGIFAMTSLSGCSSAPTEKLLVGSYNIQVVASDGVISHTTTLAVTVH